MKITAIELTKSEVKSIFDYLISKFHTEDTKQSLFFNISEIKELESVSDLFMCEAELILDTDYYDPDYEVNYQGIESRNVTFRSTFFYDGEEINYNSDPIYDAIKSFYEI